MSSFAGIMPNLNSDTSEQDEAQCDYTTLTGRVQEIDLNGDTWLSVRQTPNERIKFRLHVSKALLSFASSYFCALFGPHFLEGPATHHGKDVEMLEEKANAFVVLMKVIHMCSNFEKPLLAKDALDFALVTDKYDCVKAVKLSLSSLLPTRPKYAGVDPQCFLINAAYLLDSNELFARYTADLVTDFGPCGLSVLDYFESEFVVPSAVYGTLIIHQWNFKLLL